MNELLRYRLFQALFIAGPLTTIVVTPWISFDPVSLPKLVVLCSISFFIFGLLMVNRGAMLNLVNLKVRICALLFVSAMLLTLTFSGANLKQQVFGVFGRNTGLLAYLSLVLVLLGAASLKENYLYRRLLFSLIYTSIFMTIYCLFQIADKDPIKWSQYDTFGTLGNINFLSAFLGLSTLVMLALSLDSTLKTYVRIFFLVKSIVDISIIFSTGSIQGIMMIIGGLGILGLTYLHSFSFKLKRVVISLYVAIGIGAVTATVFGILNKGPLASFIFQPSVIFRGDYWHAGLALTYKFPFFGAGLDSYGDWYREVRGLLSTTRTNPDRIANTAHNIFLDISSSGGLLMLIPYVALLGFALVRSVRRIADSDIFDPVFAGIFVAWVAYQIQAFVSINQIGVGVWGLLFTGCLLGYVSQIDPRSNAKNIGKKFRGKALGAKESLIATTLLFMGFGISVIPMVADVEFRSARNSSSAEALLQSTEGFGASLFHKELALDLIMQAGDAGREPALQLAKKIVSEHPRSFFTWVVLYNLPNAGELTRAEAFQNIRKLDPFNPNYR